MFHLIPYSPQGVRTFSAIHASSTHFVFGRLVRHAARPLRQMRSDALPLLPKSFWQPPPSVIGALQSYHFPHFQCTKIFIKQQSLHQSYRQTVPT